MDVTLTITGTQPLIMHNGRLSDPLDPAAKALKGAASKRTKTDEDHDSIARVEFLGGLYFDPDNGPYIPSANIWRSLYDAAKKNRQGPSIKEGFFVNGEVNPLYYQGPRDEASLWADKNFVFRTTVRNQQNRVARTRPIFRTWSTECSAGVDETLLNLADLRDIAERAGRLVGLGDWRPQHGRFDVDVQVAS